MTELDLTAIREREAAATPGPWESDGPSTPGPDDSLVICPVTEGGAIAYVQPLWADGEFIAHARTDIPALLAEVDRLRAALAAEVREHEHHASLLTHMTEMYKGAKSSAERARVDRQMTDFDTAARQEAEARFAPDPEGDYYNQRDAFVEGARWAAEPSPCEMKQGEPYDFAWCETHDTTFPLGSVCRFDGRDPVEVYADEADAQRARAVRAELERDAQVEALARVRKAVGNINRLDEYGAVPLRHWIRAIDAALRTHDVSSPRPTARRVQAAKLAVKASRVTGRDVPPAVRRLAGETGDPE